MTTEKAPRVDLTGVKSTMLVTLYLRALDERSTHPILGDRVAAEVVDRIDYDFDSLIERNERVNRFPVALRAKQLDEWSADFLRRHPDAIVVQLGSGLDGRAFRLDLPDGVRWFDVDFPDVIALRRKVYPARDGYQAIGSSVTDPGWMDEIPAGGPVLIVAEGLLMYLTEADIKELLRRISERFGPGEMLFDGLAPWIVRVTQRIEKSMARRGFPSYTTATRDGREIERWNPRFTYIEHVSALSRYAEIHERGYRLLYHVVNAIPASRDWIRIFRYAF